MLPILCIAVKLLEKPICQIQIVFMVYILRNLYILALHQPRDVKLNNLGAHAKEVNSICFVKRI